MVTRQVAMATATLSFGVLLVLLAFLSGTSYGYLEVTSFCSDISSMVPPLLISERRNNTSVAKHRKLLRHDTLVESNRIWGEKCSKSDIVINQGPTAPLPNGIPTYTVEIMNVCVTGCDISGIHLNCGWFSSARLISPKIFKRLHYNDCLVNNGKPLANGGTLSFQYANTYLYPLSIFSLIC